MYLGGHYRDRGFTHSLLVGGGGFMAAALVAIAYFASGAASEQIYAAFSGHIVTPLTLHFAVVGAVVGYLAHLGLDACTSKGIWLLWPKGKRVGLPMNRVVKSTATEQLIAGAMALGCVGLGLLVFGEALAGVGLA